MSQSISSISRICASMVATASWHTRTSESTARSERVMAIE